jgi:uncharacterized protein YjbI with pentapeptide repeats
MATALSRATVTAEQLKALRRRRLGDSGPKLDLRSLDFRGASLVGCDLRDLDLSGADLSGVDLRTANIQGTDLRGAKFAPDKIILAANWPLAHYSDPQALGLPQNHEERLQAKALTGDRLPHVNFSDADLDSFNLERAQLEASVFYDASLVGARLEDVNDLGAWQLRGANLTGARLPEAINKFEGLKAVENNSKAAVRSWTAPIVACSYCCVTIVATTDAEFFGAEHFTALPFLQMKISPYGFYAVAPSLLVVMFLYLQFSLQQLWEAFASLPAYFPDGRALHERAAPFFLSGIVRTQFKLLREKGWGLTRAQALLAWLLGWWLVPLTIALMWWRSLVARLAWLTAVQLLSEAVAITASLFFISVARATLRGESIRESENWRDWLRRARSPRNAAWAILISGALAAFSIGVFQDAFTMFPLHADLSYAKLSPGVAGGAESEGSVAEANSLRGRNLAGCDASHAVMAGVDFAGADLTDCDFSMADMRNADLTYAKLQSADLKGTNLRGARFAWVGGVPFDLTGADLQGAVIVLDPAGVFTDRVVASSSNWTLAIWPDRATVALGLPDNHYQRISEKDLSGYNFDELHSWLMQHADLKGWILRKATFVNVSLEGSDMSHSDLREADFENARLMNVNFEGADLRGADLRKAQGLTQSQLNSAITDKTTKLPQGLHGTASR